MIREATGSNSNVIGSSSATVAVGPMPGSTPTAVPERDAEQADQDVGGLQGSLEAEEDAVHVSLRASRRRWGGAAAADRRRRTRHSGGEADRYDQGSTKTGPLTGQCGQEGRGEQAGSEPETAHGEAEEHHRCQEQAHPPPRHRPAVGVGHCRVDSAERRDHDDQTQQGQQAPEPDGDVPGAHPAGLCRRRTCEPPMAKARPRTTNVAPASRSGRDGPDEPSPRRPAVSPGAPTFVLIRP